MKLKLEIVHRYKYYISLGQVSTLRLIPTRRFGSRSANNRPFTSINVWAIVVPIHIKGLVTNYGEGGATKREGGGM